MTRICSINIGHDVQLAMTAIDGVLSRALSSGQFSIATQRVLMYNLRVEQNLDEREQEMGNFFEQMTAHLNLVSK